MSSLSLTLGRLTLLMESLKSLCFYAHICPVRLCISVYQLPAFFFAGNMFTCDLFQKKGWSHQIIHNDLRRWLSASLIVSNLYSVYPLTIFSLTASLDLAKRRFSYFLNIIVVIFIRSYSEIFAVVLHISKTLSRVWHENWFSKLPS